MREVDQLLQQSPTSDLKMNVERWASIKLLMPVASDDIVQIAKKERDSLYQFGESHMYGNAVWWNQFYAFEKFLSTYIKLCSH